MAELELRFLGGLEILRDGVALPLPPSRKTRALLAYLAVNGRAFPREHLCSLLWEVPDDPRGALRWSLSKLRRLVDDPDRRRIVADRLSVRFDATATVSDVAMLHATAGPALQTADTETLEAAAGWYRGNFLEGLDLPNLHDFHTWCVGERELAARAQERLLGTLVERLAGCPERALPHARGLVGLTPYDEAARARLIGLLVALGRSEEAEQHYQLGLRMLKEVGIAASGLLYRAWRGRPGGARPPAAAAAPVPSSKAPGGDGLIGRDHELARLRAGFAAAAAERRATLFLICGEAGIGKTRLLDAVTAAARQEDAFVLTASAFESEAIRPFALWSDALRRLDPVRQPDILDSSGHDNRDHLFAALSGLVARESAARPVVLAFDDLQWCDESSAAALHYVARMNNDRPVFGLLAGREGELLDNAPVQQALRGLRHDGLLRELPLGPLADGALRDLIGRHAPGADSERLSRQCGGNPLLAVELARAETAGESGSSLDELVHERLARLDVDGAEVLRWAAVLAPRLNVSLLARAAGVDAECVAAALARAEAQCILVPGDDELRFSHDLVARSIYTGIPPARRRVMHRRVAELLEQDTARDLAHAADLTHHASQSGDPALAARALVSAGRLCLRFFANDEAATLARRGLQLVDRLTDSDRIRLTLELHEINLSAAPVVDWEAAAREYAALAEQALDIGALSHARLGYYMASYVRWLHGHWTGAREESLQAERVSRAAGDAEQLVGMAETAKCLAMLERDLPRAEAMLLEAQALAERQRVSHHALPAALGMLRFHENRLDEAEEHFKTARTLCKAAGDRMNEFQANEYLVMIDVERERFDAARERCRALREIGERLRDGSEAPFARAMDALCGYALGADDGHTLDAALAELRNADAKYRLAYVLTRAALIDVDAGRPAVAAQRAEEALGYATVLERPTEILLARAALARAQGALGDAAAADGHTSALAALDGAAVAAWARERVTALLPVPRAGTPGP